MNFHSFYDRQDHKTCVDWIASKKTERRLISFCSSFFQLMAIRKMCSDFQNHGLDVKFIPISKPTAASQQEEDFQCGICSASFNLKPSLLEHVQLKHRRNKETPEEQQNQPKIELKSCSDCATKFRNDFDLYKHRRNGCQEIQQVEQNVPENIIEESPLPQQQHASNQCSECGQYFKFRIQLIKHSKIHQKNSDAAAEPPIAEKTVVRNGSKRPKKLKTKTTGREKDFYCPKSGCDFRSKYKTNISTHLKCIHGEGGQIFQCDLCPFQTAWKSNLRQHERSHSNQKPFACSFQNCDFRTRWLSNLRVHQAVHKKKRAEQQGPKKIHPLKKSTKSRKALLSDVSKSTKKAEKLDLMPRTSSRPRTQVHDSLCEELLNTQDFRWQNPPSASSDSDDLGSSEQRIHEISHPVVSLFDFRKTGIVMPELPDVPSDLSKPRISKLISRDDTTDQQTEMTPPSATSAPPSPKHVQKKCKKRKKKAINAAGWKRKPSAGSLQCPHCPYRTKAQWLLRGHLVGHGAAEPFYCPVKNCDYQTKWQTYFSLHMRKVHSTRGIPTESPRKLQMLKKIAQSSERKHLKDQQQATKVASTVQSGHFAGLGQDLSQNLMPSKASETIIAKPQKDPKSNLFLCPRSDCSFKTLYEFNMSRHVKLHSRIGSFSHPCPNCHQKFPNVATLGIHKGRCGSPNPVRRTAKPSSSTRKTSTADHPKKTGKIYTCQIPDCNFKTHLDTSLHLHRQRHKKYGKFRHNCVGCQRKFASLPALRRHGRLCDACIPAGQPSGTDSSWSNTSQVCHRKFATSAALLRHGPKCAPVLPAHETPSASNSSLKSTKDKGKWYTCLVADCNFKTRFRGSFRCHREYHQKYGILPHSCAGCQRKFPTAAALLIHAHRCPATARAPSVRAKNKLKAFACGQGSCTFRANTYKNLRIHQGMAHGTSGRVSPASSNSQSSHEPQTTTTVVQELPKLQVSAGNKRNNDLKCPHCPYKAKTKWFLNRHSIMHTGERPFSCPLCPYTGRYSWNLKDHQQRHHRGSKVSLGSKLSRKTSSCAKKPSNDHAESDASELEHNTATLNDKNSPPGGCTFCSYMSRLGKYLTKHMATNCPGCQRSTNQNPPKEAPSSTSAPEVPLKPQAALAPPTGATNFACMLCGHVAASESQALHHSRMHKTAVVALERLSLP